MTSYTDSARDDLQVELDETLRLRAGLRHNIRELREQGKLTVAWEQKLQAQVEACSRHIELQRANLKSRWFGMAAEAALEHGDALKGGRA